MKSSKSEQSDGMRAEDIYLGLVKRKAGARR